MKVEVERDKFLSNMEVYHHLCDIQVKNNWIGTQKRKKHINQQQLESICRDLTSYLGKIGNLPKDHLELQQTKKHEWDTSVLVEVMKRLNQFELEKVEKLQILNFTPRNMVTLYAIIEECDQRFDEQQSQEMLDIVEEFFPLEDVEMNE